MLARREVNWKVDIFAKVKALISEQLDIDEDQITLDTTFEDIDADSLMLWNLLWPG